MTDRVMAIVGIGLLAAFCGLLVSYIGRIDLGLVILICLIMAAFDLLYYSFKGNGQDKLR
jgi:hypothetical protein